jgi:YegS/Rv2252/BmrU family lipid kinase
MINPKSGLVWSFGEMQRVMEQCWSAHDVDLTYQFSHSPEDGCAKVQRAIDDGVDTVILVGGDGMVNTIGRVLVNTQVALGVIPAGSGNGFARHFNIPLGPEQAAEALFKARRQRIDVGRVNQRPFFVTCSMAWDAALVRSFERSPVRGVVPYVFAAVYEFFGYEPHAFDVVIDDKRELTFKNPILMTAANLTQYGGGARIAPDAASNDGCLELVVLLKKDMHKVLPQINRLFDGTFTRIPEVHSYRFQKLCVRPAKVGPVQIDGELIEAGTEIILDVLPSALTVLVPPAHREGTML